MRRGIFAVPMLVWVVSVWVGGLALAMHEVDHRYTVHGYVRDDAGEPVPDARVVISATGLGDGATAFTDRRGYYEATLHLHDKDLGEPVSITARGETQKITARFDPQDHSIERKVEVLFGPSPTAATPVEDNRAMWYGAGALLLVGCGLVAVLYRRRHGRRGDRGQKSKKRKRGG